MSFVTIDLFKPFCLDFGDMPNICVELYWKLLERYIKNLKDLKNIF